MLTKTTEIWNFLLLIWDFKGAIEIWMKLKKKNCIDKWSVRINAACASTGHEFLGLGRYCT